MGFRCSFGALQPVLEQALVDKVGLKLTDRDPPAVNKKKHPEMGLNAVVACTFNHISDFYSHYKTP